MQRSLFKLKPTDHCCEAVPEAKRSQTCLPGKERAPPWWRALPSGLVSLHLLRFGRGCEVSLGVCLGVLSSQDTDVALTSVVSVSVLRRHQGPLESP